MILSHVHDCGYTPAKHGHIFRWKISEDDFTLPAATNLRGLELPVIMYGGGEKKYLNERRMDLMYWRRWEEYKSVLTE